MTGRAALQARPGGQPDEVGAAEVLVVEAYRPVRIELLPSARVNEALDRLGRNDVRYRFVLDMSDLS
ncbi:MULTISPECIES: hypothetical protein [unclassified Streptomyces]|uniref:hypothetical protein n=1 Tax=unclassified Streptomyces TaxID=2593676 RepID=UPI002DDC50B1|nr:MULTISPECIES: hypothetical protein [unclassified Streptomyces]WSF90338.1 hypothetical protein OIE70_40105 [Streptomyces sp. NBC_01744]WSC50870.1 hypothetical protein OIE61_05340 [Streptomyces sp. NBC_01762]WSC59208.1 hypothetical protein OG808_38555 [Streptomyces sp. NBC_01761]WSD30485.1 hypothetical protein OHA26_05395 [Streptomyces sp. NBC_01751]WSJ56540.1 hypothetical protein OG243_38960 [Streptomyces sp. NBC_01318]